MSLVNSGQSESVRKWNWYLLAASVAIYFFVNFQRSSLPGTIFNELQSDFKATAAQVTAVSAVFMYVYAATQLIAGLAVDKFGGVRTIFWGGLLFCIGSLIIPFCGQLPLLLAGRVLVGLGAGTIYLALVKEIDRIYPEKFTSVLGTVILLGYAGSILGGLPLSKAVTVINWRWAFAVVGVMTLLAYCGFVFCKRHISAFSIRREKLSVFPFLVVLRSRNSLMLLLAGGVGYAVYYLMLAVIGKKLLEDFCGTSPTLAGACLSMMVVISGSMNFLIGFLSTRYGNLRKPFFMFTMLMSLIGAILGLIGLHIHAGSWFFIMVMMLFAGSAGFSSVSNSLMREYNPPQYTGSAASILNFVAYLAVAVCGNLAGYLMEYFSEGKIVTESGVIIYPTASYTAVFIMALIIAVVATAACSLLPETHGNNLYKMEKAKRRFKKV